MSGGCLEFYGLCRTRRARSPRGAEGALGGRWRRAPLPGGGRRGEQRPRGGGKGGNYVRTCLVFAPELKIWFGGIFFIYDDTPPALPAWGRVSLAGR